MELSGFIRFLGKTLDVPNVLRCIDIGVLVSSSESFSNAIVEYMATGLPVVCTDVGGAREAVEDGVNGFVVDPGNYHQLAEKIMNIIEKNIFAEFGKKGMQKSVDLFSTEKVITQYENFYKQAVCK
jgi:glycosyltransferase involved in cell wall biosynthesis